MMILLPSKCDPISQSVFGKKAVGVPYSSIISGIEHRGLGCLTYPVISVDTGGTRAQVGRGTTVTREEPDFDKAVRAFHGVEAPTDGVEGGSVAVSGGRLNATSRVAVGVGVTVVEGRGASHGTAGRHGAVGTSMESHSVG